jgi:hypothetical protein
MKGGRMAVIMMHQRTAMSRRTNFLLGDVGMRAMRQEDSTDNNSSYKRLFLSSFFFSSLDGMCLGIGTKSSAEEME